MDGTFSRARWGPVLVAVAAVLVANLIVAALGLQGDDADPDLPGWLVGGIWIGLFACLGAAWAALWRASDGRGIDSRSERAALVGLGLICLAYPFYTGGFELRAVALVGTAVTFVYAAALALWFRHTSRFAAALLVPLLAWLIVAGYLLL